MPCIIFNLSFYIVEQQIPPGPRSFGYDLNEGSGFYMAWKRIKKRQVQEHGDSESMRDGADYSLSVSEYADCMTCVLAIALQVHGEGQLTAQYYI